MTIDDVARAAGVSAMTVSRVINGGRNVRDSTRAAVQEAVQQLNYAPNSAARSLAAGESAQVGLLYANPSAAYLSQFLIGALGAAKRLGAHLQLESCVSDDPDEQAEVTRRLATSDVDGFVLPPPLSESKPILAELEAIDLPVVTLSFAPPQDSGLNVRIDDCEAALEMTRYLIGLGHRRIGFIKGHPNDIASADRHQGFLKALEEAGLDAADQPIEQGYFTYRSGLAATERILSGAQLPTAIFASNDDMAAAAVSVAHRRGLQVPRDISVVGFDDTAVATTIWPELTTVRQPIADMADAALELLMSDLKRRRAGSKRRGAERVLAHELVVRESSGPPPAPRKPARRSRSA
ncbi:LacI family DNA-binding transcriptional regulator [Sphingomonas ginkgonis]|uniref:LacI family DNA-binding transcriptional regulator n=1 Tax=Sphingomonas ginkgonis TaxID=2315330 RepID=UPI001EF0F132|nr:LacI family DNA-binding transcriptional regulator [Sphingomonas ginkgonis]